MISGLAPGSDVVTWMMGKSTVGSDAVGNVRNPKRPSSNTPAAKSDVATGRLMKGAEIFTTWPVGYRSRPTDRRIAALASPRGRDVPSPTCVGLRRHDAR